MSCRGTPSNPASGPGAAAPCNSAVQSCPAQVTVQINLSAAVACPGHPLEMTAVGTPSGGTYTWTSANAQIVDSAGAATKAGDTVYLRHFKADDATGKIPEHTANVSVTYTHPSGTASSSKAVKVHKIEFDVTDTAITAGVTQANESGAGVVLGAGAIATMVTDPKVKIKLDASCPRKTDCAKNHRVGWLQTALTNDRRVRYTHTLITKSYPVPVRDGDPAAGPSPFPFYDAAPDFTADADTQTVHHEDSPQTGGPWTDPRGGAPAPPPAKNRQLRKVFLKNGFAAWLVVQNKEWSAHDLTGSFAYQKNFDWSAELNVDVDTSKAVGSRCTPASNPPTISALSNGKGGRSPTLDATSGNELLTITTAAAPGI